jgi:hypothetical protein
MTSVLTNAKRELGYIHFQIASLEARAAEIETFIRIYNEFNEPQPETAAQTVPAPPPAQSSAGTPEAVESVPPITVQEGSEPAGAHNSGSAGSTPAPATSSRDTPPPVAAEDGEGGEERAPSSPVKPTLKERIKALHAEHPEFTAQQAKDHLGCSLGSLGGYSSILKIKWARAADRGLVQRPEPSRAPEHRPEPSLPQASSAEPGIEPETDKSAFGPDASGEFRKIVKPKGKRVMLRTGNGTGQWLHQSLTPNGNGQLHVVDRRADGAWIGTQEQLRAVRRLHPETAAMFVVDAAA